MATYTPLLDLSVVGVRRSVAMGGGVDERTERIPRGAAGSPGHHRC